MRLSSLPMLILGCSALLGGSGYGYAQERGAEAPARREAILLIADPALRESLAKLGALILQERVKPAKKRP